MIVAPERSNAMVYRLVDLVGKAEDVSRPQILDQYWVCRLRGIPEPSSLNLSAVCTYTATASRHTDPRLRVRVLEDRLRVARAKLEQVKLGKLSLQDADLDIVLDTREGGLLSSEESFNSGPPPDEELNPATLDSMMRRRGRLEFGDPWAAQFYGAPSGAAFLHRLTEFFGNGNSPAPSNGSSPSTISLLFDAPLPSSSFLDDVSLVEPILPQRQTATALISVVFAHVYPVFLFLHEPTFHEMVERLYIRDTIQYERADHQFLPLFSLVIGLGYLFSQSEHRKHGCRKTVSQGLRYYLAARKMIDITACRNLCTLQILLCYILFLISTARLASAHGFLSLACSSALRLGLHHRLTDDDTTVSPEDRDIGRNIFWTILKLDIYLSAVLGLPTLVDLREVIPIIDVSLKDALHQATSSLPNREAILLGASAKHLEIMLIISKAIKTLYPMVSSENEVPGKSGNISVSLRSLEEIEARYHDWGESTSELLTKGNDGSTNFIRLKYELEMASFFGKIILYRPFLHYLAKSSDCLPAAQKASQRALACVKIASAAITRSEAIHQLGLLRPASWTSIYTTFLSVVCLVFLIATREGTHNPAEAWRKAVSGIRLLAATSCHETGSKQCLGILKDLVRLLSHTVDLDVHGIEASTPCICTISNHLEDIETHAGKPHQGTGADTGMVTDTRVPILSLQSDSFSVCPVGPLNTASAGVGLHFRDQRPATSGMQEDNFPYDPSISLPALNSSDMDSTVWDSITQGLLQTSATNSATSLSDEMVDVPTLQHFTWPHDGITENYFSDMLGPTNSVEANLSVG
ncbi:Gypsy retrotransposon integrase-like protein 1 [Exophiala sideris]|nr:Gypsy retrotransposon integrase-like protein 1 [Exophiala sideris]KAK5023355.1 Gypsy retrotransposon integrase-like protein 1 [Exophiala sideris]KAK5176204.1 Gypsy retrotransposon integrase-like protein 1 [Eurotiomycetes sp. CCFEE 6388]